MSARATILMPAPALAAWLAAPLPRPPQPTRPTLSTSLPAAWTVGITAALAAPTAAGLRKSRRDVAGDCGEGNWLIDSVLLRRDRGKPTEWFRGPGSYFLLNHRAGALSRLW